MKSCTADAPCRDHFQYEGVKSIVKNEGNIKTSASFEIFKKHLGQKLGQANKDEKSKLTELSMAVIFTSLSCFTLNLTLPKPSCQKYRSHDYCPMFFVVANSPAYCGRLTHFEEELQVENVFL